MPLWEVCGPNYLGMTRYLRYMLAFPHDSVFAVVVLPKPGLMFPVRQCILTVHSCQASQTRRSHPGSPGWGACGGPLSSPLQGLSWGKYLGIGPSPTASAVICCSTTYLFSYVVCSIVISALQYTTVPPFPTFWGYSPCPSTKDSEDAFGNPGQSRPSIKSAVAGFTAGRGGGGRQGNVGGPDTVREPSPVRLCITTRPQRCGCPYT